MYIYMYTRAGPSIPMKHVCMYEYSAFGKVIHVCHLVKLTNGVNVRVCMADRCALWNVLFGSL